MKLNESIRKLRREKGMTQAELAKKMHLKQYNISDYEIGRIEPNVSTLIRLADVFGVSMDELFGKDIANKSKDVQACSDVEEELEYISKLLRNLDVDQRKQVISALNFFVANFIKK